jgi:GT2 family glycosyltransferase
MSSERVVAVVVTYNRKDLLCECLRALLGQSGPVHKILVINNQSTDGTLEMLQQEFSSALNSVLSILTLSSNVGGAGGFYAGMKAAYEAGADWIWLLDDDTIAQPDTLLELFSARAALVSAQKPRLVASKVLWLDGSLIT